MERGLSYGINDETLIHFLAALAPEPTAFSIKSELMKDHNRNPHNDSYKPKLRSEEEIICDLRYQRAQQMLEAYKRRKT